MRITRSILMAVVLVAALACRSPVAPVVHHGPPPNLHDPEIFFHFGYYSDSVGGPLHTEPYPDTAVLRWYKWTVTEQRDDSLLLAQVGITGTDTLCAFFLAPDSIQMFFDVVWHRHDSVSAPETIVGPLNSTNPLDTYWDISVSEDTLAGSTTMGIGSKTTSYCPEGMARDSITPRSVP